MSYSLTDFSPTEIEFNDGLRNYYYKKCYCSVELQGEYIIFTSHRVESNAYRQQWSVLYSDFTTPSGDAAAVLAAIEVIINSYAGGAAGVDTVTATSPITSTGGSNPNISTNVNKNRLIGRNPVTAGVMEEISIGSGLTLIGTTLSNTATPTPLGYYGMWQDNVTQTAPSSNVGLAMIFRTTDLSNGVSVVTNGTNLTRITFANTGIYNLQFSSQFQNVDNALHDVTIWLRLNGSDVAGSSGFVSVPQRKNPSEPGHIITSWNYLLDVVAGQYYELYWSTTNHTFVSMQYYPAGSPPPSTASVILTVTQQSGIMAGTGITAINSLTGSAQTLGVGTSGTDFAVSSSGTAHTLNLPTASATNRGALSSADYTAFTNAMDDRKTGNFYRKSQRWYVPSDNSNTLSTVNHSAPSVFLVPFPVQVTMVIDQLAVELTGAGSAGSLCRFGIYRGNPTSINPSTLLVDSGDISAASFGVKTFTPGTPITLTPGLYFTAFSTNSATVFGVRSLPTTNFAQVIGTTTPGNVNLGTYINGVRATYGALPSNASSLTLNPTVGAIYALFYRIQ
jgi:hypothetical protein